MMLMVFIDIACSFQPGSGPSFAVFGNAETKSLIQQWKPNPVDVPSGDVMLPASTENMKRFVRARILLEENGTGCIAASIDGSLSVVVCKFGEHNQLLLPLWQPNTPVSEVFKSMRDWHTERLGHKTLTGAKLNDPDDQMAWAKAMGA
eukprot:CAMPEP_0183356810 /NCGR_PEP_ID=MMETSP0164_2-20130417/45206_1 /TAXON_ID=221442 /ORGANISM="Coccolithus pelagicus ssp braarudi, Strain PLY182g" /LENGTH=147 /DNA_ID=CAMNT_0025530311 /DNA_START=167 /DNA_END=610 /DNA_ORIENTATION=+